MFDALPLVRSPSSMEAIMGLATAIRHWHSSRIRASERDALGPDQREALARDIGLPADVLGRLLARGNEAGAELTRLMETLSLNPDRVRRMQAALMRDMSVTCSECAAVARCRRELEGGRAASVYTEYCPNAETLGELRAELSFQDGA
jgi:hypothetical protein